MKRSIRQVGLVVSACAALVVAGCSTYYKAVDPQSGREYYTKEIDDVKGGAVKLKDARSGAVITLQSSEVKEISEKEFEAGLAAPAAAPAAAPTETK